MGLKPQGVANHTLLAAFLVSQEYPLKHSAILDSGTTIHVFNDLSRFYDVRRAPRDHYVVAGDSWIPILAYGSVDITVKDVAFCTDFQCNLVSFDKLRQRGYYWDTRKDLLLRKDDSVVCKLDVTDGQRVLEYNWTPEITRSKGAAFVTVRRRRRTSRDPRYDSVANGDLWHLRIGHISQWPLHKLRKTVLGAKLRGPCTTEYEDCAFAKLKRQTSRRPPERPVVRKPCHEIHID
jgi:hypothetical protein